MSEAHQAGQRQTHTGDRQLHLLWEDYCQQSRQLGVALATIAAMEHEVSVLRRELGDALTRASVAEQVLAEYVREEGP